MKTAMALLLVLTTGWLTSCAHESTYVVPERIGPTPAETASTSPHGVLQVFSAFEVGPPSPTEIDNYTRHHTDYTIRREDGSVVTQVTNRSSALGAEPAAVELPPGHYTVTARANGLGSVSIPVLVAEGRSTVIHLESDAPAKAASDTRSVRLPDGRVIGWRATDQVTAVGAK